MNGSQGQEELRTQLKNGLDDMMTFVSETEQAQVRRGGSRGGSWGRAVRVGRVRLRLLSPGGGSIILPAL